LRLERSFRMLAQRTGVRSAWINRREQRNCRGAMNSINPIASDKRLLEGIAREYRVPAELLSEAIELELSFYRSGRRRGLFPALREIISRAALSDSEAR
jgi:hypothetical protein